MKKVIKKNSIIFLITILFIGFVLVACTLLRSKNSITEYNLGTNPEMMVELTYDELTEEDKKVDNCEYVEFSAFFTRDLNSDGYAERLNGACNPINALDTLYIDLNVLSEGYLKDGKITLNADKNYEWNVSVVEDMVIKGNYIGNTSEITLQDKVLNGSQKIIWGDIYSNIGNNINNYSKVNSVTLTGTHVIEDENGNIVSETEINKKVDLKVDWYGTTKTKIDPNSSINNRYIQQLVNNDEIVLHFSFNVNEISSQNQPKNRLLLQKQVSEVKIPDFNGYEPTSVIATNSGVRYEYNEDTKTITIIRESAVDEFGNITTSVSATNYYRIKVVYPIEAYNTLGEDEVILHFDITADTYGYNNNTEIEGKKVFNNPYVSSDSRSVATALLRQEESQGIIWRLQAYVGINTYQPKRGSYGYTVSKAIPMDIYNGNINTSRDSYAVKWYMGIGDYTAIDSVVLEEPTENDNIESDKFNDSDSMYNYITTTSISFEGAKRCFGEDGWIKLYNAETNELIHTFTASEFDRYSSTNKYPVYVKSIKIETSKPISNSGFYVCQIKEINDEELTSNYTKEAFEDITQIYTYLRGTIKAPNEITYENGAKTDTYDSENFAYYDELYSNQLLSVSPSEISTQKTENINLEIRPLDDGITFDKWKDGVFLIELPEKIIKLNVKKIIPSSARIKILDYYTYKENGKYYIKIKTENEIPLSYSININADVVANPLLSSSKEEIKLYAFNKKCDNYDKKIIDEYDIDGDGLTTDIVGFSSRELTISYLGSSGIITTEYITDYNDLGDEITIAPNIARIEKDDNTNLATINLGIASNYKGTLSEILILGKFPFEGNTYTINGNNLCSEFTASIVEGITIPEKLKDYATVYYSENENTNKNLTDSSNNWITADNVADWSKIKTYLIDLGDYVLQESENEIFTYRVNIPSEVGYNKVSYSHHAVYYCLDTVNGKIEVSTEPNKVGIQAIKKYNVNITKTKQGDENFFLEGATYRLTTTEEDGEEISQILKTDANGKIIIDGVYMEKEYTLKEISAPDGYVIDDDEIKFKMHIEDEQNAKVDITNGNYKSSSITTDSNGKYVLNLLLEDEPKYNLQITKTKRSDSTLKVANAVYRLVGTDNKGKQVIITGTTDENGVVNLTGIYLNKEYTLTEVLVDSDYVVSKDSIKFVGTEDSNGKVKLTVESEESFIGDRTVITNAAGIDTVKVNLEDEARYTLIINKTEESGEPIKGIKFKLTGNKTARYVITDENGQIKLKGLVPNEEYELKEIKADGYYVDENEMTFVVTRDDLGKLAFISNNEKLENINIVETEGVKQAVITAKITNEKIPTYNLQIIKVEEDSEKDINKLKKLANAQFGITSEDTNKYFEYTTDANGSFEVSNLYLHVEDRYITGKYVIEEMVAPSGYINNGEKVELVVTKTADETLEANVINSNELETFKAVYVEGNNVTLVLQNKPLFKLIKIDSETEEFLPNAEFVIIEMDEAGNELDYAKDGKGEYIGVLNDKGEYVVTTDEHGVVELALKNGWYKVVEINYPTGYVEGETEEYFRIEGSEEGDQSSQEENQNEEDEVDEDENGKQVLEIEYIEDLVALATDVNEGNNYEDYVIVLKNDLDFKSASSYRSGEIDETLIQFGFEPIGKDTTNCFSGIFDGQNHKIDNIEIEVKRGTGNKYLGLFGYVKKGKIKNLKVSGNILAEIGGYSAFYPTVGSIVANLENGVVEKCTSNVDMIIYGTATHCGGIVGDALSSSIRSCKYSGSINSHSNQSTVRVGGIVADLKNYSSINNCYNIGEINSYADTSVDINKAYAGGIVGEIKQSNINNSYNLGNVSANSYWSEAYAGGIAGASSGGTINNCYNTGNIRSSYTKYSRYADSYAGGILAYQYLYETTTSKINNSYCLDTVYISGKNKNTTGNFVSDEYMKSYDFYTVLNIDNVWLKKMNKYPILNTEKIIIVNSSTEITIKNTLKKYKITTEVKDGIGGSISGENDEVYEFVSHGKGNTLAIEMLPEAEYFIDNITVNGEKVAFSADEESGKYTIPAEYFSKVTEDKHIVVTYMKNSNTLTIRKVDAEGNALEGVDFEMNVDTGGLNDLGLGELTDNGLDCKIPDDEKEVELDIEGALVPNGDTYTVADKDNDITPEVLSSLKNQNSSTYTFVDNGNGSYNSGSDIKGNAGASNSYFEIDLSSKSSNESFVVVVNANISSRASNDYGYATISSSSSTIPSYNTSTGRFIYISGTSTSVTTPTDYQTVLTGGGKYYLYLGYRKASSSFSGTDEFNVNSIKVYKGIQKVYGFQEKAGVFTPDNLDSAVYYSGASKVATVAKSYIPIDLTGKEGNYFITVNAQASSTVYDEYLYATVNQSKTTPEYYDSLGRLFYIYNQSSSTYESDILQGGKIYYLHLGYRNLSSETIENVQIDSIKLYKTSTFAFENVDGKYVSTNAGKNNTYSNSYIPLDLTKYQKEWKVKVSAEISANKNNYGFVAVTDNTTPLSSSNDKNNILFMYGTEAETDGNIILEGGKKYYIHLGYRNRSSDATKEDKFTVNSITIEPVKYTVTTDVNGTINMQLEDGQYKIKEIKTLDGYRLDKTEHIVTIGKNEKNTLTVINKRKTGITVHHYLKGTDNKVAEDDFYEGDIGDKYATSPHIDLEGLHLEKDLNGAYIVPSNASGIYGEDNIIVTYYYELEPIKLIIHHYLEGNDRKIIDDEYVEQIPEITFEEKSKYTLSNLQYNLNNNENYNNLSNLYRFVNVVNEKLDKLDINDNYIYNTNSEITYYYSAETINLFVEKEWTGLPSELASNYKSTINIYENIETAEVKNHIIERNGKQYALIENAQNCVITGNAGIHVNLPKSSGNIEREYIVEETKAENNNVQLKENEDYIKAIDGSVVKNTLITNMAVKKQWKDLTEEQARKYRATLEIYKMKDSGIEAVKDSDGNNIQRQIVGNGEVIFNNIELYENGKKVKYTIKEVLVEKTEDGGETWKVMDESEYKSSIGRNVNAKSELVDEVQIGDYVNYNSSPETEVTYLLDFEKIGLYENFEDKSIPLEEVDDIPIDLFSFSSNEEMKWRVLNIDKDNGIVQLIADKPTQTMLSLYGLQGYKNSIELMDNASSVYAHGKYAESGRSIRMEDIDKIAGFDISQMDYSDYPEDVLRYGDTVTITSGMVVLDNGDIVEASEENPVTLTCNDYWYDPLEYIEDENVYNMLFGKHYFIANKIISHYEKWNENGYWTFDLGQGVFEMDDDWIIRAGNTFDRKNYFEDSIMPVITLQANLTTTGQDENGVWQLDEPSNDIIINTLLKSYKVQKNWNIANSENYRATFKLYQTIDGVKTEVTDENTDIQIKTADENGNNTHIISTPLGTAVTVTVTGNGAIEFNNLPAYKDGSEITYSVEETLIETTKDNGTTWENVTSEFKVKHYLSTASGNTSNYDDEITNYLVNRFGLNIYKFENVISNGAINERPLENVEFNISIKNKSEIELADTSKIYKTGEDGKLLEAIYEIVIGNASEEYTVTITEIVPYGYKQIEPIIFTVNAKLSDDGETFELTPETKTVENTQNVVITEDAILVNIKNEKNEYQITTEVVPHNEYRTNEITGKKENVSVEGGEISGQNDSVYEVVTSGNNSTREIIITPDENYAIGTVTLTSSDKAGNISTSILYDKNNPESVAQNPEITAILNQDGTMTIGTFSNIMADKNIKVEFEPIPGTVIVHHYLKGTGEEFENEPVAIESRTGEAISDLTITNLVGEKYETSASSDIADIYELVSTSNNTTGVVAKGVTNVYYYYDFKAYNYRVEYYYDGIIATDETIHGNSAVLGSTVSENAPLTKIKNSIEYNKVNEVNNPLVITSIVENNVIKIYYNSEYNITTKVLTHDEQYSDETKKANVKGGTISGDSENPYEKVFKGEANKKSIVISPANEDGNVDYEIALVTINGSTFDFKTIAQTNDKVTLDNNGILVIKEGFFEGIDESKHIEVEFRKKSKVIVKYLEEETGKVLYKTPDDKDFIEITGLEGDKYTTEHKIISGYKDSSLGITDEDGINIAEHSRVQIKANSAEGSMYANEFTIIYWYKKNESKVTERHIEINEKGESTELASKEYNGYVLDKQKTYRGDFGENYIPVDGPESPSESITVARKDEISKEVTITEEGTNEVWYYYEKQFNVVTGIKSHTETVIDVSTGEEKTIKVEGGTISKEYKKDENGEYILDEYNNKIEVPYEMVLNRGDSKKKIVIKPDDLYRIKSIEINDSAISLEGLDEAEDGSITLPEAYFKDVQEDKYIVVEFERIPAKVIVNYLEKTTEKTVAKQEIGQGWVGYEYTTHEKEIPYYELLKDELPDNSEGVFSENDTIVNYWYRKLLFNLKVTKKFTSVKINGRECLDDKSDFVKVSIANTKLDNTTIEVKYIVAVTNTGEIAGTAKVVEQIPVGFKASKEMLKKWSLVDGNYEITTGEIQPGETVEYEVILNWDTNMKNVGRFKNIARIENVKNVPEFEEYNLVDNEDSCVMLIEIRTGDSKENKHTNAILGTFVISMCAIIYIGNKIYHKRISK